MALNNLIMKIKYILFKEFKEAPGTIKTTKYLNVPSDDTIRTNKNTDKDGL